MAAGATAGFSELGGAEGGLLLAKSALDCRGWRDAGTESLLGFLETRMRRLFVKSNWNGAWKNPGRLFYPRVKLSLWFGL